MWRAKKYFSVYLSLTTYSLAFLFIRLDLRNRGSLIKKRCIAFKKTGLAAIARNNN
jgi:hypothetical protein